MNKPYTTILNSGEEKHGEHTMKRLIIYYSHSGNNGVLAERIAETLHADSFRLIEDGERTVKRIILDMIFHRKPTLHSVPQQVESYDQILFMGPIWMFHICSPLMSCMKAIRKKVGTYSFISLSGGGLGPNTKPIGQLKRMLGNDLALFLDLQITQLCTVSEASDTRETSSYLLKDHPEDLNRLLRIIVPALEEVQAVRASLRA